MIILLLIISIAVAVFFYRNTLPEISLKRKLILSALRTVFIFLLLLFLFNPILYLTKTETQKPSFLFLIDKSNSMNQLIEGKDKSQHLKSFEEFFLKIVEHQGYKVKVRDIFSDNPKQSNIYEYFLNHTKADASIEGIVLLSDGWLHDDPAMLKEIIEIPLFSYNPQITISDTQLKINNLIYNKSARIGEIHPLLIDLEAINYDGTATINLKNKHNRIIDSKAISFSPDNSSMQIDFELSFKENGLEIFEIEFMTEDKKVLVSDFAAIQVIEKKNKILIITDSFNWNIRFFNRVINSEDRFEADLIYQKNRQFYQQEDIFVPEWQEYSGFILINNGRLSLNSNDSNIIKDKVFNGSGLISLGNIVDSIQEILPVTQSNIRITAEGHTRLLSEALTYQIFRDYELEWNKLSPINFYYQNLKEQAVLLAEAIQIGSQSSGTTIPAISQIMFGSGNVIHFSFLNIWNWLAEPQTSFFNDLTKNIMLWIFINNSENFYANTSKNVYYQGEIVVINLFAFDEKLNPLRNLNAKIDIMNQNQELVFSDFFKNSNVVTKSDGFTMSFKDLAPGEYSYNIIDDLNNRKTEGQFSIVEVDIESKNIGFNTNLLNSLSSLSKGKSFTRDSLNDFSLPVATSVKIKRDIEIPLYKNLFFIIIFLVSFCLELYLRKKWSLL